MVFLLEDNARFPASFAQGKQAFSGYLSGKPACRGHMQKAKGGAAIWRKAVRMAGKKRSVSKKADVSPFAG